MAEHAEVKKRQSDFFRKEDLANGRRYVRKCIPDASNYEILEEGSLLYKRGLFFPTREESLV